MNARPELQPDAEAIGQFVTAMFRYADADSYVSLRAFRDDVTEVAFIAAHAVGDDLAPLAAQALKAAHRAANMPHPVVFAPPVATFTNPSKADEVSLANGLALSVECDATPDAARSRLEALLGPATVVVASGGEWLNPATGEVQDKLHLHWRLTEPTREAADHATLKQARQLAQRLVGADASNTPAVHPIRWPGSWHRKRAPRIARIVALNEGREVDLVEALETLREAAEAAGVTMAPKAGARPDAGRGEARDMAELVRAISAAEDYHAPLAALAMRFLRGGTPDAHAVLTMRGIMLAIPEEQRDLRDGKPQAGRWQSRFDDIPRAVATARAKIAEAVPPMPSLALLRERRAAPAFPLELLGPVWARRIEEAAEGKNSSPDYVAAGLLAGASACIGNARWAAPWQSWSEPPFLWIGAVGNPSSGKTPGMGATFGDVVPELEKELSADYPEKLRGWETLSAEAAAIKDRWEKEVVRAVKADLVPPRMPQGATPPPRPVRPRLVTSEPTIEAVALLLQGCPRGLVLHRDELAAFIGGFDKYGKGSGGGGERAAWLESWNGKFKAVDRAGRPEPILVPRFGLGIVGTIQPDRLEDLTGGPDDGLAVRFLWTFPEPRPFARPKRQHDAEAWQRDLGRVLRLALVTPEEGEPRPWFMRFSDAAAALVEEAAQEWDGREANATGLMLGALGKARGHMIRLALVVELLRWCAERPGEEAPTEVGEEAAAAAAGLMDGYFLPMAERAFGAGALTEAERHARTLLRHIVATKAEVVNERAIRDTPGLRGLSSAEAVKAAVTVLRAEDVLLPAPQDAKPGRPRADHVVNPRMGEAHMAWRKREAAA